MTRALGQKTLCYTILCPVPCPYHVSAQWWCHRIFIETSLKGGMHFYNKPIHTSLINLISIMDLSNRVVVVRSTLTPEEEEYPSFSSDDISILFWDIATPTGLILNKGDPRECYVVFLNLDIFQRFLTLLRIPSRWVDICI